MSFFPEWIRASDAISLYAPAGRKGRKNDDGFSFGSVSFAGRKSPSRPQRKHDRTPPCGRDCFGALHSHSCRGLFRAAFTGLRKRIWRDAVYRHCPVHCSGAGDHSVLLKEGLSTEICRPLLRRIPNSLQRVTLSTRGNEPPWLHTRMHLRARRTSVSDVSPSRSPESPRGEGGYKTSLIYPFCNARTVLKGALHGDRS